MISRSERKEDVKTRIIQNPQSQRGVCGNAVEGSQVNGQFGKELFPLFLGEVGKLGGKEVLVPSQMPTLIDDS